MASSLSTTKWNFPYPSTSDVVDVAGDIQLLSLKLENTIESIIRSTTGAMVTDGNTETGINVTYDTATALPTLKFELKNDYIQDIIGNILGSQEANALHENIIVDFVVDSQTNARSIILKAQAGGGGGGAAGSASLTDIWFLGV